MSFGLTDTGFSFGLPTVTASEKAIVGGFKPDVAVETGAESARVSAYDTLTVTVDHLDGAGEVLGQHHHRAGITVRALHRRERRCDHHGAPVRPERRLLDGEGRETTYGLVVTDGEVEGGTIEARPGRLRDVVRGARRR